ncbi:MAG: hypothetical protein OXH22_12740 [Chloroflexi bacterium]|nr:hypothetical protein [Chloroflexota bacterium]
MERTFGDYWEWLIETFGYAVVMDALVKYQGDWGYAISNHDFKDWDGILGDDDVEDAIERYGVDVLVESIPGVSRFGGRQIANSVIRSNAFQELVRGYIKGQMSSALFRRIKRDVKRDLEDLVDAIENGVNGNSIGSIASALTFLSSHSRQVKAVWRSELRRAVSQGLSYHSQQDTAERWLDMVEEVNEDLR